MNEDDRSTLLNSVGVLTLNLCGEALRADWSCADDVTHADRLMKVLYAYGRNVEKLLAMEKTYRKTDEAQPLDDDTEAMREDLYRRLALYADRLGPEELGRRLEQRGVDLGALRMEILGEAGSDPAAGE